VREKGEKRRKKLEEKRGRKHYDRGGDNPFCEIVSRMMRSKEKGEKRKRGRKKKKKVEGGGEGG